MRCSLAVVALALLAAFARTQSAAEPEFTTGDVERLGCRVVGQGGVTDYGSWLEVEVDNRGVVAAEPLVFEVTPARRNQKTPTAAERAPRAALPDLLRYGRPVAPGKKQRYWLRTAVPGAMKALQVRVVEASFHDGPGVPKPDEAIGAIDHVQRTSLIGEFPVPQIELHNPFDRDLDVLLLVTLTQPRDTVELYGARIEKGATLPWVLWSIPTQAPPYLDADGAPGCAVRVGKIELVDWLLVADADAEAGAARFGAAYDAWLRWPEPRPTLQGRFDYRGRQQQINRDDYQPLAAAGGFTLHPDGKLVLEASGTTGDAERALRSAFADVRRKSGAELLANNRCLPITPARVELHGPGFDQQGVQVGGRDATPGSGTYRWYELDQGRIAAEGWERRTWKRWQTRDVDGGYLVTRRSQSDDKVFEQFSWCQIDGLWAPAQWHSSQTFGDKLFREETLRLTELRVTGAMDRPDEAPTGDGAEALRALWEQAPHVETAPLELTAQVEVRNPGTDLVWAGHTRVTGTLRMRGVGRNCREIELDSGGKLEQSSEHLLAAVIHDRFMIWVGRDFNDRAAFGELFRRARIDAADAAGVFEVHGCPVAQVHTRDARVVRIVYRDGRDHRYERSRAGEPDVVTTVHDGVGTTKVTLQRVDGHLLPVKLHFERIFDRDWGPETITLRDLKVH